MLPSFSLTIRQSAEAESMTAKLPPQRLSILEFAEVLGNVLGPADTGG